MVGKQELTGLRLRKQTLVLESDLNRMALRSEWEVLRTAGSWMGLFGRKEGGAARWPFVVTPLAGVLVALGFQRSRRLLGYISTIFMVLKPFIRFWRSDVSRYEQTE
jgi:hypothetical protein